MWLFYNRFTLSRKINDPSDDDIVDEIGEMCYQWAITRKCFSKSPKFSKWKPGMDRTWPTSKSLPHLIIQDKSIDAPLDWIDLPDYFCEFRDLRLKLEQEGEIHDKNNIFIHHIHIKKVDEVIEFSILQETLTDEDNREWEDIDIYPPKLINEITNKFNCEIKGYQIKNSYEKTDSKRKINLEENILDKKRKLPLILIPEFFDNKLLTEDEISDFCRKMTGFGEVWIFEGDDYFENFQSLLRVNEGYAIIFSPDVEENDLYGPNISKKITSIPFDLDFSRTSHIAINEVMRRTRSMGMRSEISKMVSNALSENRRRLEEEKEQEKIEQIINKNISIEEKNIELVSRVRQMSNQLMEVKNDLSKSLQQVDKINIQKDGLKKKYDNYKMKYNEIKNYKIFHDEVQIKARESGLSINDIKEKINLALDGGEIIDEEIEYTSIFQLVQDLKYRYSNIIFSNQVFRSAKNADNTGRYGQDEIRKIKEFFYKLNNHFFEEKNENMKMIDFHNKMRNLFPGRYSDESVVTLSNIKNYSGNDRRIFPVLLPEKGELGIEMTWHIKPTSTIRINIICLNYGNWDIPLWSKIDGKWYRNYKKEKGTTFGNNKEEYPKIIIGYCGVHLKTFSQQ